ncbi:MAG: N-formylglutamate amidohydrolase [Pseudomonadota bacterium]
MLVCEHASNHIPPRYAGLGLPPAELQRHIAWDIGTAALSRRLSALLDAPLILSGASRLLIDCNRPPGVPSSIPIVSEATVIPGNQGISAAEAALRRAAFFDPFEAAVTRLLDARLAAGRPTVILGIHSFTPVYLGRRRVWQAGVLYLQAIEFGARLRDALREDATLTIGDNEPYQVNLEEDYTVPVHGDARGIPTALIEVRQDLLADAAGIEAWAQRLAAILARPAFV